MNLKSFSCMWILRYLLFALFLFIVVTVAAFVYLPWYIAPFVSLATAVALYWGGKWMVRWTVRRLGQHAMDLVGVHAQVLKGASMIVHAVEAVPPWDRPQLPWTAEDDEHDEDFDRPEDSADRAFYRLDVTIIPKKLSGSSDTWQPQGLQVVEYRAPRPDLLNPVSVEPCILNDVEVERNGVFVEVRESVEGRQRLRATVAVPADWREIKFRYLMEDFGHITLPG
jgi:hypothetical protein